jgi:chemotaxis protein histidine kinase CheA
LTQSTYRDRSRNYGRRAISIDDKASEAIAERLKALGEKYSRQFPERKAEILSLWETIEKNGSDLDAVDSLYRLVHGLAGSGATFGFPQVSEAAKQCECVLLEGMDAGQIVMDEVKVQVDSVLAALQP